MQQYMCIGCLALDREVAIFSLSAETPGQIEVTCRRSNGRLARKIRRHLSLVVSRREPRHCSTLHPTQNQPRNCSPQSSPFHHLSNIHRCAVFPLNAVVEDRRPEDLSTPERVKGDRAKNLAVAALIFMPHSVSLRICGAPWIQERWTYTAPQRPNERTRDGFPLLQRT